MYNLITNFMGTNITNLISITLLRIIIMVYCNQFKFPDRRIDYQ